MDREQGISFLSFRFPTYLNGISVEAEDGRIDYFCCSHVNHHFMALSRYLAWRGATILLLLIFFQKLVLKIILGIVQHLN